MKITTQVKGNKKYFYLKHSFRNQDSIVVTKSKYLGDKIPDNIEKIKSEFYEELNYELFLKLDKIKDNFQKEWKKMPLSVKQRELSEISIAFTYNTNAIEGSTITLAETREILESKMSPKRPIDDVDETRSHSKVFLDSLKENNEITKDLILDWHKKIFENSKSEIAGKFRDYQVRVGNYYPPEFTQINTLMEELCLFIKNSKLNRVEVAFRAHYFFEKIHPFGDGNGRIGRLLMNYILWHSGFPMMILEYKERMRYYREFEKEEDLFNTYFMKLYLKVHKMRYLN